MNFLSNLLGSSKPEKIHIKCIVSTSRNPAETANYAYNAMTKGKRVIDRYWTLCNEAWNPLPPPRRSIRCLSPQQAEQLQKLEENGGAPRDYLESLVGKHVQDYQEKGGILIKVNKTDGEAAGYQRLGVITEVK